jgi:hypothetical protein
MTEWIKCSDKKPKNDETVLVSYKYFAKQLAYYEEETDLFWPIDRESYVPLQVTHWMPLHPDECNCPTCSPETREILEQTYWKNESNEQ